MVVECAVNKMNVKTQRLDLLHIVNVMVEDQDVNKKVVLILLRHPQIIVKDMVVEINVRFVI